MLKQKKKKKNENEKRGSFRQWQINEWRELKISPSPVSPFPLLWWKERGKKHFE
jgi:subtilisin-like proprotein convertase family protein